MISKLITIIRISVSVSKSEAQSSDSTDTDMSIIVAPVSVGSSDNNPSESAPESAPESIPAAEDSMDTVVEGEMNLEHGSSVWSRG